MCDAIAEAAKRRRRVAPKKAVRRVFRRFFVALRVVLASFASFLQLWSSDDLRATCDQLTALRTFPQASGAFVSFPTPRPAGHFPQRRSRRSARSSACTVSHSPSSKTDGSHDGRSHPRRERGARGAHASIGEICRESARSRRHAGVRRASPRRRRRRRERALPQSLAQAGYRPRGRRGMHPMHSLQDCSSQNWYMQMEYPVSCSGGNALDRLRGRWHNCCL